mgnify:CR=1 FL=1
MWYSFQPKKKKEFKFFFIHTQHTLSLWQCLIIFHFVCLFVFLVKNTEKNNLVSSNHLSITCCFIYLVLFFSFLFFFCFVLCVVLLFLLRLFYVCLFVCFVLEKFCWHVFFPLNIFVWHFFSISFYITIVHSESNNNEKMITKMTIHYFIDCWLEEYHDDDDDNFF